VMADAKQEIELLKEAFYHFDTDRDFYLSLDELRFIVTNDGEKLPSEEAEEFLAEARNFSDPNGYVDYQQFAESLLSEED